MRGRGSSRPEGETEMSVISLRKAADGMQREIDRVEKLGRKLRKIQTGIRAIADRIEAGDPEPMLAGLATKRAIVAAWHRRDALGGYVRRLARDGNIDDE